MEGFDTPFLADPKLVNARLDKVLIVAHHKDTTLETVIRHHIQEVILRH